MDKFVPVIFQKLNTYENETEDTRFLKVKIWLMHTGKNLNGTYFERSVVENSINTLANTPILAYIEDNSEGEVDFSDHRMVLVKEDGQFKVKYIGQAIGVIPSDNNAKFENRVCDDGVEREFLTCEGLVWTKWDDPIDIFSRDSIKFQSMELHDDYEGEWMDDNLFHFTSFKFFGACALGKDVLPAMRSATIEVQFSYDNMFKEIQEKIEQFKHIFNLNKEGGSQIVNEKLELLTKYSFTEEDLKQKNINIEDFSVEELETKLQEITKSDFVLVASQLKDEIKSELYKDYFYDEYGYKSRSYWYVDHTENMVIAEDTKDNYRLVGFPYSVNGDIVEIDFESKKRMKIVYEPIEDNIDMSFNITSKDKVEYELNIQEKQLEQSFTKEKETVTNKLNEVTKKFTTLEEEVKSLREFKELKITEERVNKETELFDSFSAELTEEELQPLKETASEFTLEQLEEKLFTLVGKKKANFSKQHKKEKQPIKIEVKEYKEDSLPYGGIFSKYTQE
ncbi:hypothetical protein JK635_01910 [Neobacillus sp. YIM B02564]|uniref:Uncharacterized protein n=1 Tax=Neobacillus paridis TaxID=2803862 RepID=A0ABS1TI46_9BACI|nr:hypothetical protein [Neobacillus paridis]